MMIEKKYFDDISELCSPLGLVQRTITGIPVDDGVPE